MRKWKRTQPLTPSEENERNIMILLIFALIISPCSILGLKLLFHV
jgi:hypothetical protein